MPTYDTAKLRDLILATVPRNDGEADADYFARCTDAAATIAAAGRAVTSVVSRPSSPETMVKLRTLDWLFDAVAVRTILLNWDQAVAGLTTANTDDALAAADQLTRTRGYMAGTGPLDGIDVSDPGVRAKVAGMIETNPPVLAQAQADAINALGTVTTYAVAADLSDQQVTDEIAAMADEANQATLLAEADRRYQLAYDGIGDGTLTTLDQVRAVLGGGAS